MAVWVTIAPAAILEHVNCARSSTGRAAAIHFYPDNWGKNKKNFEHIQGGEAQKLLTDSHKPVSSLYNLNM
jgi:hypothetical protein